MEFSEDLLIAVGAWQNGWGVNQERRAKLAKDLKTAVSGFPAQFRTAGGVDCYRKRYLHKGELVALIMNDERIEDLASWTTNLSFAERFRNQRTAGAVTGAIFRHRPADHEVLLNIPALWADPEFAKAAVAHCDKGGAYARELFHFKTNCQGEVVLEAPLRGSQIISLTGISSPFDELCDRAGLPEEQRDKVFREMVEQGTAPGLDSQAIGAEGAQRVISRTIKRMLEMIDAAAAGRAR